MAFTVKWLVVDFRYFYVPDQMIERHIVFVLSVCLLSTLTFPITF